MAHFFHGIEAACSASAQAKSSRILLCSGQYVESTQARRRRLPIRDPNALWNQVRVTATEYDLNFHQVGFFLRQRLINLTNSLVSEYLRTLLAFAGFIFRHFFLFR